MKYNNEQNLKFYKEYNDLCDCLSCQYYYANAYKLPTALKEYLHSYCIDISKPVEVINYIYGSNKKLYEVFYLVCGPLEKEEEVRINNDIKVNLRNKDKLFEINIDSDYFLIDINGIEL